MNADRTLLGRRVVVTGSSRGIGRAIATHLAKLGASIGLVGRDRATLDTVRDELAEGPHAVVALDVRDGDAWASAVGDLEHNGEIHGLVTAAGINAPIGQLGTWDPEVFRSTLDVNVTGTLLAILACLPGLTRTSGSVVTMSGGGATSPLPRFDAYAASKAAVVRLTENLASDFATANIRLNSVAPGFVLTDMHAATIAAGPEAVGASYFERTRRAIEDNAGDSPQLAAELIAYLMSDESAGISGKLVSARWDPWRAKEFRERLRSEVDFATLRRIDGQFFDQIASSTQR